MTKAMKISILLPIISSMISSPIWASYKKLNAYGSANQSEYNADESFLSTRSKKSMHKSFRAAGAVWLTLAPDVKTIGHKLKTNSTSNKQEYMKNIFGYIIQKANDLANEDHYNECENQEDVDKKGAQCKPAMNWTYYSFLVAALTVPFHESRLNHFRVNNSCDKRSNSLQKVGSSRVRRLLSKHYKNEEQILAPECRYFSKGQEATQVFSSPNMDDFGIMQMNGYYHPEALEPFNYLNKYKFIDRGLEYFYNGDNGKGGFNDISQQYGKKYAKCNFTQNPFQGIKLKKHQNTKGRRHYGIIRASWDKYNKGGTSLSTVCRFRLHPKNGNVKGFKNSLDYIVVKETSLYHSYLPKGSLERRAFNEIIYNFKSIFTTAKEKERNYYINKVLDKNYRDHNNYSPPKRDKILNLNNITTSKKTNIYLYPNSNEKNFCGTINENAKVELSFANIGNDGGLIVTSNNSGGEEIWARVRHPQYSSFVKKFSTKTVVKRVSTANIRTSTDYTSKCKFDKAGYATGENNCLRQFNSNEITGVKQLPYLGTKGSWYKVDVDGQDGWVSYKSGAVKLTTVYVGAKKQCLNKDFYYTKLSNVKKTDLKVDYSNGEQAIAAVTNNIAIMRAGPSTANSVIKRSPKDSFFIIVGTRKASNGSLWYKVRTLKSGSSGWIWGKSITPIHKLP